MTPFPWQRAAVAAFHELGGLVVAAPAGSGKTWVNAQCCAGARAVYVCPASVLKQTIGKLREYGVDAVEPGDPALFEPGPHTIVISYSIMSRRPGVLNDFAPTVLVLDEGQRTKRVTKAAWSAVPAKYVAAHPDSRVVVSTGSIMHRSVVDYGHLLVWALRRRAPCGTTKRLIEQAARFAEENPEAWRERLETTPGIFLVGEAGWQGAVDFTVDGLEPLAADAYERALASGVAPDGWVCEDQLSRDELCRQLAWGFYLRREPRPSPALVEARRGWARAAEHAVTYGLATTPLGARSVFPEAWAAYAAAEAREPARQVVEWLAEPRVAAPRGTIVWVRHIALGEALAARYGWPYHREGAVDATGVHLGKATAPVVLASIAACSEGVDGAQLRYARHLVLEPPSDPRQWQQLIARLARLGQPEPRVTVHTILRGGLAGAAYSSAIKGAHKIERETGQPQWLSSYT